MIKNSTLRLTLSVNFDWKIENKRHQIDVLSFKSIVQDLDIVMPVASNLDGWKLEMEVKGSQSPQARFIAYHWTNSATVE